jgi:hypothetical protein
MAKMGRPPKDKPQVDDEASPVTLEEALKDRIATRTALAKKITELEYELAKCLGKFIDDDVTTYTMLSHPDCLFSDCPISSAFTKEWARQQLYASGLKFGEDVYDGEISVKPFSERIEACNPWIMKFSMPAKKSKTGIEAIL